MNGRLRAILGMLALQSLWVSATAEGAEPPKIESVLITLIEEAEVPAREAGVLADIAVREGQLVEEGELLAQMADAKSQLAQRRAELELRIARETADNDVSLRFSRKSLEVARAEQRRADESVQRYKKSISQSELDRLRLVVEKTVLEVEQAERDLRVSGFERELKQTERDAAALDVQRRRIEAPIAGVVVEINHRKGEWVQPGEKVVRILRIDRLRAEGFMLAADVPPQLEGRAVKLSVNLDGQHRSVFPGRIVFVSPEVDPVNKQVRVWAEIENRGLALRPGLPAEMTLEAASRSPAAKPGTGSKRSPR